MEFSSTNRCTTTRHSFSCLSPPRSTPSKRACPTSPLPASFSAKRYSIPSQSIQGCYNASLELSFNTPPDTIEVTSSEYSLSRRLDSSSIVEKTQTGGSYFCISPENSDLSPGSLDSANVSAYALSRTLSNMSPSSSGSKSGMRTPVKEECEPTCFCRRELDTFGRPPRISQNQLPSLVPSESPPTAMSSPYICGVKASEVRKMIVPRFTWGQFRLSHRNREEKKPRIAYQGPIGLGVTMHSMIVDEDLWEDERNPFLLTRFDFEE